MSTSVSLAAEQVTVRCPWNAAPVWYCMRSCWGHGMDASHQPHPIATVKRRVLFVTGSVALVLGIIGVFVPLLPTTPFLLLAAACFIRSSPRAYRWLMGNRLLGGYIRSYRSGAGIPLRVKVFTLCLLWLTIGYSAVYIVQNVWVRVGLGLIAVAVTAHIVAIRTAPSRPSGKPAPEDHPGTLP